MTSIQFLWLSRFMSVTYTRGEKRRKSFKQFTNFLDTVIPSRKPFLSWSIGFATVIWGTWWILLLPSRHSVSVVQKCWGWRDQVGMLRFQDQRQASLCCRWMHYRGGHANEHLLLFLLHKPSSSNEKCLLKLAGFSGFDQRASATVIWLKWLTQGWTGLLSQDHKASS